MKKTRSIIILTALLLTTMLLTGCVAVIEPLYTVWTHTETNVDYILETGTYLPDGRYTRSEINSLSNIGAVSDMDDMHLWTRDQITDWFTGRGFSSSQAQEETAWFTTVNHGIIVCRSGSLIYSIRK